jgi:hypothetical protein
MSGFIKRAALIVGLLCVVAMLGMFFAGLWLNDQRWGVSGIILMITALVLIATATFPGDLP